MVEIRIAGNEDCNRAHAPHEHANWAHRVVLWKDGDTWVVSIWTTHGASVPERLWNRRAVELCCVHDGTADLSELLAALRARTDALESIAAGRVARWNGGGYVGDWADNEAGVVGKGAPGAVGKAALRDLNFELQQVCDELPTYWPADDYVWSISRDELVKMLADAPDCAALAQNLIEEAVGECYLDAGDLARALEDARDALLDDGVL